MSVKFQFKKSTIAAISAVLLAVCGFTIYLLHEISELPSWNLVSMNTVGQIETDGTLRVVDQRTIDASANTGTLNWEISETCNRAKIAIDGVRVIYAGAAEGTSVFQAAQVDFSEEVKKRLDDGQSPLDEEDYFWCYDKESSWFYLSMPKNNSSREMTVEVSYKIDNAFYVYDDVAELYWNYLPHMKLSDVQRFASRDSSAQVTATVLIPVTDKNTPKDLKNVWAWGHGHEGTVEFLPVGGYLFSSTVNTHNIDSQAHVIFPSSWLENLDKTAPINVGGARLGNSLSEEAKWMDSSTIAQGNDWLLTFTWCLVAATILVIATCVYYAFCKNYKALLSNSEDFDEHALLNSQITFDAHAIKFKKVLIITSLFCLIACIFAIVIFHSLIVSICFAVLAALLVIFMNWTPTIHSCFLDII